MTIVLIFTLFLVSLNTKIASVEQGLEIGGCNLRVTREGLGTWPSPSALEKCPEEDICSYFEKGCRKKCTRQSRKVLWVVLNALFFKGVWKNDTRGHVCLRVVKESNKSRFDSFNVRNSVLIISHIAFRDCRVHICCDNLSRNSCIQLTANDLIDIRTGVFWLYGSKRGRLIDMTRLKGRFAYCYNCTTQQNLFLNSWYFFHSI